MRETEVDSYVEEGPLLFGRVLDGKGGGREISWEDAWEWKPVEPGEVLWLHILRTATGLKDWLQDALGVPGPTAELLVSGQTRPRAFREGDTLVATLRGINFNPGAEPEDMISMQIWSDGKRVITLRRLPMQTPRSLLGDIDAGYGATDAGALITQLTEHMIARMNRSIVDMNDHIDELEAEDLEDNAERVLGRIATIRRNCLALKRHMSPQHEALEWIARDAPDWFEEHDRREIAETIDRLRRYLDDLDISKESAVVLMDEIRAGTLARSERTSLLLAVVASVFLPLTFISGLIGMNVGIPLADEPLAFWGIIGICASIAVVQVVLFRRWGWL